MKIETEPLKEKVEKRSYKDKMRRTETEMLKEKDTKNEKNGKEKLQANGRMRKD